MINEGKEYNGASGMENCIYSDQKNLKRMAIVTPIVYNIVYIYSPM